MFDLDDIDAAFAELDARYLAGEAAGHAQAWSEIVQGYAALNRHEIPPTSLIGRPSITGSAIAFAAGDLTAYSRSAWDLMPDVRIESRLCID